jgi:U4/U6.U5 tri-snRNP-associated protein 1
LSASDTAEKAAADNFAQKREAELKAQQVSELQEKLAKSKNKRDLKKKLDGKGLGEAEDAADATLDSLAWVERMKKRQTELALRKQKELEEQDRDAEREAKVASAAGLRVGHALDTMLDDNFQGETILVLKDTTIEENEEEGDELVSIKLLESEKTKKKLEAGKKKAMYDPMAEEDQNLLAQYDETISGPEKGAFVLGDEGAFSAVDEERRRQEVSQKLREQRYGLKGTEMTLDYSKTNEIRDYYTQEEESQLSTFKKVKKKDKKKSRTGRTTRILDEEDEFPVGGNEEEMDTRPDSFAHSNANAVIEDVNFVDDDELQGALARARRLASKKKAGMVQSTEAVADAILGRNGHATTDAGDDDSGGMVLDIEAPVEEEEEADPDMVISDTANFVRALQNRSVFQEQQAAQAKKAEAAKQRAAESAAEVRRRVKVEEEEAVKKEPEDGDGMDWQEAREGSAVPSEVKSEVKEESEDEQVGDHITDEPLVAAGLGATLALLGSRGALEKLTDDDKDKEGRIRKQQEWLKQQRIAELEKQMEKKRERERNREKQQKGKGGGGQQWEEEKTYAEEQAEERKRLRDLEEKFKNYKPEINIDYVDEFGRTMKQKEVGLNSTLVFVADR